MSSWEAAIVETSGTRLRDPWGEQTVAPVLFARHHGCLAAQVCRQLPTFFFSALTGICYGSGLNCFCGLPGENAWRARALIKNAWPLRLLGQTALARDYRSLHQESRRAAPHCSLPRALRATPVLSCVEPEIGKCPFSPKLAARYGPEVGVLETLFERRRWPRRARVTAAAWRRLNVSCPSSVF